MSMKKVFDTERNGRDSRKTNKAVARGFHRRQGKEIVRKEIKDIEKGKA